MSRASARRATEKMYQGLDLVRNRKQQEADAQTLSAEAQMKNTNQQMGLQGLRNKGSLDTQGLANKGGVARQGLANRGSMNVQGLKNKGDMEGKRFDDAAGTARLRLGHGFDMERDSKLNEMGVSNQNRQNAFESYKLGGSQANNAAFENAGSFSVPYGEMSGLPRENKDALTGKQRGDLHLGIGKAYNSAMENLAAGEKRPTLEEWQASNMPGVMNILGGRGVQSSNPVQEPGVDNTGMNIQEMLGQYDEMFPTENRVPNPVQNARNRLGGSQVSSTAPTETNRGFTGLSEFDEFARRFRARSDEYDQPATNEEIMAAYQGSKVRDLGGIVKRRRNAALTYDPRNPDAY